jgi:hypothetical protein
MSESEGKFPPRARIALQIMVGLTLMFGAIAVTLTVLKHLS